MNNKMNYIKLICLVCMAFVSVEGLAQGKINRPTKRQSQQSVQKSTSPSPSAITIKINGAILESSSHRWWATAIDLNSDNTIVHKVVAPKTSASYISSTKDEYIEDCDTGRKYYILSSSINMEPNKTYLYSIENKIFSEKYPLLPNSVKRINIGSNLGVYVRNLQIR